MKNRFNKDASVSARIEMKDKIALKKSGYNVRQAIEYFNSVSSNKLEALKIEQYFLNKEIEDTKYNLIAMEMKAEDLQKEIDNYHIERISYLRVESYKKIVELYTRDNTNSSFNDFVAGRYIQEKFIEPECSKFPDCDMESFCSDLIDYYNDVIIVDWV